MKQVKQLLVEGQGRAARERFSALVAEHPEKLKPAAGLMLKILEECCDQGMAASVRDFLAGLESSLPAEAAAAIRAPLEERLAGAAPWVERLAGVTRERLARECRRSVVLRELPAAADCGRRLLARSADRAQLDQNARYLAQALSELTIDRERADEVVYMLGTGRHSAGEGGVLAGKYYAEAVARKADRGYDQGDRAWSRQLTEAILFLAERLPGQNELGEPTPEQFQRFCDEAQAIFGAGLGSGDIDDFIDAAMVLVDFCPIDEAAIKSAVGVEERYFLQLGPRARLTAVRAFKRVGEQERVRRAVLNLADSPLGKGRLKLLAGIMGGLGHQDFFPWLEKEMERAPGKLEESWIIDAVSRIDHPRSAKALIDRLTAVMRRIGDRDGLARADDLLKALGRLTRLRGFNVELRNQVIRRASELTDHADRSLSFAAAERLFSNRLEEVDPDLKAWAVRKCLEAMWSPPPASEASAPVSANGWRQPMVTTLIRLGSGVLPTIIEESDRFKTRYSGAMGALGNVLEAIGDDRAVPLMNAMIHAALLQSDDGPRSKLLEEKMRDPTTGDLRNLDRDELVHDLFYSLMKFGGEAGLALVLDYAAQAQAGRIVPPGDKTTGLLFDARLKHASADAPRPVQQTIEIDEKTLKTAIADAKGGLFSRAAKRIAGIAILGQSRDIEAVPALVEAIGDKDAMVASAAHTALAQFMHPLPDEREFSIFWDAALDNPKVLKGLAVDRLMEFIRREAPKNPPYDLLFERQLAATIEDEELAHRLRAAMRRDSANAKADAAEAIGDAATDAAGGDKPKAATAPLSDLDKKRLYMQARRAWLDGGKKGPPPSPPD